MEQGVWSNNALLLLTRKGIASEKSQQVLGKSMRKIKRKKKSDQDSNFYIKVTSIQRFMQSLTVARGRWNIWYVIFNALLLSYFTIWKKMTYCKFIIGWWINWIINIVFKQNHLIFQQPIFTGDFVRDD